MGSETISILEKHINKAYLLKALLVCLFFIYISGDILNRSHKKDTYISKSRQ